MASPVMSITGLSEASIDEKLALIDELWESVRHSMQIETRADHLVELEKRVAEINADPTIALSPSQARALLQR